MEKDGDRLLRELELRDKVKGCEKKRQAVIRILRLAIIDAQVRYICARKEVR